jgi:DNA modification methylase
MLKESRGTAETCRDYQDRKYLSSIEAAQWLGVSVRVLHEWVRTEKLACASAASGQKRFDLQDLIKYEKNFPIKKKRDNKRLPAEIVLDVDNTWQKIYVKSSMRMKELADNSIHLMVTSPPYFNAKLYSREQDSEDLGNIHNLEEWFENIGEVWKEVFRVLEPGRKAFINIMNLPIRTSDGFRSLNLVGRTIDLMEKIGFVFKRDIIWQKTNGVRAHFGTYPYPGGILINHMHEFILEFNKPDKKGFDKYGHLTKKQKEDSKLDKDFWLKLKNTDIWIMNPEKSGDNRSHAAPFPYELPHRIIKAFTYITETVLDPFLGSGTTLKASLDLQRNGVGYEIVPEIAEQAVKRLKND